MGENAEELAEQTIIQLELYNYIGQSINATSMRLVGRNPTVNEFTVDTTSSSHPVGVASGVLRSNWALQGNVMTAILTNNNTGVITNVSQFEIKSVTTEEKEYTKFKFVD